NGSGTWKAPNPVAPVRGTACAYGGQGCTGTMSYHPTNLWGANSLGPFMGIQRAGDYNVEVSTLTDPGIWGGRQILANRQKSGESYYSCFNGCTGKKNHWALATNVGMTVAMAFSSNLLTS